MNTDKKTPCFIRVHPCSSVAHKICFCGVVAQLDSLAHPNCEDDFRSPETHLGASRGFLQRVEKSRGRSVTGASLAAETKNAGKSAGAAD
jgi:hypothetical protein